LHLFATTGERLHNPIRSRLTTSCKHSKTFMNYPICSL
jgi:hypothetical protein